MPVTVFELPDGNRLTAEVEIGDSVMRSAVNNDVPGIVAECGGALTCATCHVHVDVAWYDKFPVPGEAEADLLEIVDGLMPNSRLSCQLLVSEATDGAIIRVPAAQAS